MHFFRVQIIQICRGTFHAALDYGGLAAGTSPCAEQAGGGYLSEDGLFGFVFHEANEGFSGGVEREDVEIDDVGGGLVDQGLGSRKGAKVAGVCVANADIGGGTGVPGVRGGVLCGLGC